MRLLYPEIQPYAEHVLEVAPPHRLHVEECGTPDGLPALFLHGGPGVGCDHFNRRFFDPELYRIVLFDQRGAGRSVPHGELEHNHTGALIEDIETIRETLGIKRWVVFGGSWGSTLALAYAEAHPDRVLGLILRGIFLCRRRDIRWFYQEGAGHVFPEHWEEYVAPIPREDRGDLVAGYHRVLSGNNELARMSAAKAWSLWEARCATLRPNEGIERHFADPHFALALARIECHYFRNHAFLEENQLLDRIDAVRNIPGVIVHGRYDMICPVDQAWALHRAWPEADLQIIRDAGHSSTEPGIVDALVRATLKMAHTLGPAA